MYRYGAPFGEGSTSTPYLATHRNKSNNVRGLDDRVGRTRLQNNYEDTMVAFRDVVELGKKIEGGEHPDVPVELMREFNELRLAALALRNATRNGKYGRLTGAVPYIERYIAMAMQYAQERGLLPKPNPEAYRIRQTREWLRTRQEDSQPRQALAWLRGQ